MAQFKKGDRVQPRGYLPATVVTGNRNLRNELLVEFDNGHRLWLRAVKMELIA